MRPDARTLLSGIIDRILNGARCLAVCAVFYAVSALVPAGAVAGVANGGIPGAPSSNPLAGMPWGIYRGSIDGAWAAYTASSGKQRQLVGKIALRPSVHWFGYWDPDAAAADDARQYILDDTGGRPDVLAQLAVFRVDPWEGDACSHVPGPGAQASYKRWIDSFAAGIGSSRVALILQPDLPFALCEPGHSRVPMQLVSYAAKVFDALPHTTIYIDVGAADWLPAGQAARLLEQAGIRYARGFSLNDTHYDSTGNELMYGAKISRALSAAHIPNRHFVISTVENGAPYIFYEYRHGNPDFPAPCPHRFARSCLTLGIPPTWDTSDRRWGLTAPQRAVAARLADAYLWIGRPWLNQPATGFDLARALSIAATTPF